MTLLVTGFEPFGGEKINPSWEAVKRLPDRIGEHLLVKKELPVVFGKAAEIAIQAAEECNADGIFCVGQAGGRDAVTPELYGVNKRSAKIPDNDGNLVTDEVIRKGGAEKYRSTLPVEKMAEAIAAKGIPAVVSKSAGTFVCNDLLYSLLERYAGAEKMVCFLHIPFLPEQAGDKFPALTLEQDIAALTAAIEALEKGNGEA